MENLELHKKIALWIIKDCLSDASQPKENMVKIPTKDILKILVDTATDKHINPDDYDWMKDDGKEPKEITCARELGVEMNDEFLQIFKEISDQVAESVLEILFEKAVLISAEKDADTPLN